MALFWRWIDELWDAFGSAKLTFVVLICMALLSIPGTIVLQQNISNVDPGIQYDYNFWKFGQITQLFTAYHSFWYVALLAILSMNLIICSIERWPGMYKLAVAKPIAWAKETFDNYDSTLKHQWQSQRPKEEVLRTIMSFLETKKRQPVILEDSPSSFQIFWQTGRWSRVANYLVHTSLLIVFAGAIFSALYGFDGAVNIPAGSAVDTLVIFKEGRASGLAGVPGGLPNERKLGFRLEAEEFKVNFYEDWPGRPKDFITKLNVLEKGRVVDSKTIRVNDPFAYKNFTFYQASYGRLGDFRMNFRVVNKENTKDQTVFKSKMGEVQKIDKYKVSLVPVMALMNVQGLGPGVQFQPVEGDKAAGEAFWVLKDFPNFDAVKRTQSPYIVILDNVEELYFTGLQIGHVPGAPIYWFGCFGMLLGTFYALFVSHKKYQLSFSQGRLIFVGNVHRLPVGFQAELAKWAAAIKSLDVPTHQTLRKV